MCLYRAWLLYRPAATFADVEETGLKRFGANVRKAREASGFSQESFALHAKIGRSLYGRIERGEQNVELTTVLRLAMALEIKAADLFEGV